MLRFLQFLRARFRQKRIIHQPTDRLLAECGYIGDDALPCILFRGHSGEHF